MARRKILVNIYPSAVRLKGIPLSLVIINLSKMNDINIQI